MMWHGRARRGSGRSIFVGALAVLVGFQMSTPVWAWGRVGHRVIARFAEKKLNPKAKAAIAALLEPGESLMDASTWADENRAALPKTAPWHYVDVPLNEAQYNSKFSADLPEKGCIVDKIHEFRKVLKNPSRPVEDRRLALRFLVHLIQDLHMPLLVGDNHDKGGNRTQVRFYDRETNMHQLWDSDMIERAGDDEDFWLADLAELDTPGNRDAAMKGTVEDWATESLRAARAAYRVPQTGKWLRPGEKLGDAYQETNLPVVRRRLYQAGVRLALVLNATFPEK